MFSVVVIVTQLIAVIFIGAFGRSTSSDSTSSTYFLNNMVFLLGITLIYIPYKKLALHSIAVLTISLAITFQTYVLMATFWDSCFNGFSDQFQLNIKLLVRSTFCQFAVLLIFLDFIGIFGYWQIYLIIAPIIGIGYSLNSAILIQGLSIFDGGGGIQIFLFSGILSLFIWLISIRGKVVISLHKKPQHYTGYTLSMVGIAICFVTWPQFNQSGSLVTVSNTILTSSATLQASAVPNTIFALSIGLLMGMLFLTNDGIQSSKMKLKTYVDCFINAGIVCASYSDIELNPSAGMTLAIVSTILTLVFYKYIYNPNKQIEKDDLSSVLIIIEHYRPILFRIFMPILGLIVCSIVIATRETRTPALLNNTYSQIAGLQWAGLFITIGLGAIFGLISGLIINCFVKYKVENSENEVNFLSRSVLTDLDFFDDLNEDIFPLYLSKEDKYLQEDQTARRIIKQSLLSHLKSNSETKKHEPQNENKNRISKDFTKSNIKNPYSNVSQMKNKKSMEEQIQDEESMKPLETKDKQILIKKSYLYINKQENQNKESVIRRIDFDSKQSDIENEKK